MSTLIQGPLTEEVLAEHAKTGLCSAGIPTKLGWLLFCEERAYGVYRFACIHEHVREAQLCDVHGAKGLMQLAGCVSCRDSDASHDCGMAGQLIGPIA